MAYFRCVGSTDERTQDVTFTVEGAKADNITIKDSAGTVISNVIFGASDTYKEVTLTIPEAGGDYTFESSVAKATDGSGSNYSKTVALSSETTNVKLMPNNALYWYGNECLDVTNGYIYGGESGTYYSTTDGVTSNKATNNLTLNFATSSYVRNVWFVSNNAISLPSGVTKICSNHEISSGGSLNILISTTKPNSSGNYNSNIAELGVASTTTNKSANLKATSGSGYVMVKGYAERTTSFNSKEYALWFE